MAAKSDKNAGKKADKKALKKQLAKVLEKAQRKSRDKADRKEAEAKAAKKAEKKKQGKADRAAEERFLDEAIAADTAVAQKAVADAKRELVKERSLVTRKLLKAKELAEKIAAKQAKRIDASSDGDKPVLEPIATIAGAIPGADAPESTPTPAPARRRAPKAKTATKVAAPVESMPVPRRAPAAGPRSPRESRTGTSAVRASAEPSESWTMVALRAYAGTTGLTGYSRLNKADLLAKLRDTDTDTASR